jgi:ADP-ribosylglycohydrolase
MIGAQIRGDYFGYINPGDPEKAAEMAFRDACISHTKNGIYGEMFAAAMIACAAVTDDIEDIIRGGLAEIPETSRLYDKIDRVIRDYHNGVSREEAYARVKEEYAIKDSDSWLHTIPNAAVCVIGLLYGEGDFGKSICAAVEVGYDTDCNGATVGSVMGMRNGTAGIGEEWTKPTGGKLETTLFGVGILDLEEAAEKTMKHMA